MSGTRVLVLLMVAVVAAAVFAQDKPRDQASDKAMIVALENGWNQAELHHDADAIDGLLADTFISIDHHGKLQSKMQYMADLKDTSFNPEQISNLDLTVYIYGDTAIVTSAYRTRGKDNGKPFVHHGRFTDVWVRIKGSWKCVANQETFISE
jgi:ketosteroid isomerase-like protein